MEGLTGVPQFSVPLGTEADNKGPILKFVALSFAMFLTLSFTQAYTKREEIKANWSKYQSGRCALAGADIRPDR